MSRNIVFGENIIAIFLFVLSLFSVLLPVEISFALFGIGFFLVIIPGHTAQVSNLEVKEYLFGFNVNKRMAIKLKSIEIIAVKCGVALAFGGLISIIIRIFFISTKL